MKSPSRDIHYGNREKAVASELGPKKVLQRLYPSEENAFAAGTRRSFHDYAERCSGKHDVDFFLKMRVIWTHFVICDRQKREQDTRIGAFVRPFHLLGCTCVSFILGLEELVRTFIQLLEKLSYDRQLCSAILSDFHNCRNSVKMSACSPRRPLSTA